jgi:DNA polymerase III delta subunit
LSKRTGAKMITYFYGDDSYMVKKEIAHLASRDKGALVLHFNKETTKEFFLSLANQSFFDPYRIFVLTDALSFFKEDDFLKIGSLVKGQEASLKIVAVEKKPPLKGQLKHISETKKYELLKGLALVAHIKSKAKELGGDISPLAAERLASYVGNNLWQVEEELKKLTLYKREENEVSSIETADVDLLVHANFEANIFNFVDSVAAKNMKKAESLLGSFMDSGENPLYLLTMITKQIRNIAIVKFDNLSESELTEKAAIHPFVAKKTIYQAKNFSKPEIKSLYQRLMWADLNLKSGGEPGQVLQKLIV